jgi:hypothetical protein
MAEGEELPYVPGMSYTLRSFRPQVHTTTLTRTRGRQLKVRRTFVRSLTRPGWDEASVRDIAVL